MPLWPHSTHLLRNARGCLLSREDAPAIARGRPGSTRHLRADREIYFAWRSLAGCDSHGGLRMLDGNEADDKIIAVLKGDAVFGSMRDISECPEGLIQRLIHFFLTYKQMPGGEKQCEVTHAYGRLEAHQVILQSKADYDERFADLYCLLDALLPDFHGAPTEVC
jgi:hypothetical protein